MTIEGKVNSGRPSSSAGRVAGAILSAAIPLIPVPDQSFAQTMQAAPMVEVDQQEQVKTVLDSIDRKSPNKNLSRFLNVKFQNDIVYLKLFDDENILKSLGLISRGSPQKLWDFLNIIERFSKNSEVGFLFFKEKIENLKNPNLLAFLEKIDDLITSRPLKNKIFADTYWWRLDTEVFNQGIFQKMFYLCMDQLSESDLVWFINLTTNSAETFFNERVLELFEDMNAKQRLLLLNGLSLVSPPYDTDGLLIVIDIFDQFEEFKKMGERGVDLFLGEELIVWSEKKFKVFIITELKKTGVVKKIGDYKDAYFKKETGFTFSEVMSDLGKFMEVSEKFNNVYGVVRSMYVDLRRAVFKSEMQKMNNAHNDRLVDRLKFLDRKMYKASTLFILMSEFGRDAFLSTFKILYNGYDTKDKNSFIQRVKNEYGSLSIFFEKQLRSNYRKIE